jgi:hypothetical protein
MRPALFSRRSLVSTFVALLVSGAALAVHAGSPPAISNVTARQTNPYQVEVSFNVSDPDYTNI